MGLLYLFNDPRPRATMRLVLADDARISATKPIFSDVEKST